MRIAYKWALNRRAREVAYKWVAYSWMLLVIMNGGGGGLYNGNLHFPPEIYTSAASGKFSVEICFLGIPRSFLGISTREFQKEIFQKYLKPPGKYSLDFFP